MTKEFLEEAQLVDLSDDELKELLGHTHQALKNLDEQKKNDPDIEQMRATLKAYIDDNYTEEERRLKARKKAAFAICDARGIKWKLPEGT